MYQEVEYEMRVAAGPDRVFPLLCPVREHDWVEGWRAEVLRSASGVAEAGCVFATGVGYDQVTWVVHRFLPPRQIGFTLVQPDAFIELLEIEVTEQDQGSALRWRRAVTPLTAAGQRIVEQRIAGHAERHRWLERALDHHLATGGRLARQG